MTTTPWIHFRTLYCLMSPVLSCVVSIFEQNIKLSPTWHSTYRYYFTWFVDHLTLLSFRCKSQILNIRKCHDFLDSLQKILTNDVSGKKFFVFPNVFRVFLRVETRDRHIHSKIMYWLSVYLHSRDFSNVAKSLQEILKAT